MMVQMTVAPDESLLQNEKDHDADSHQHKGGTARLLERLGDEVMKRGAQKSAGREADEVNRQFVDVLLEKKEGDTHQGDESDECRGGENLEK